MSKLIPMDGKLIIKRDDQKEKTPGGILLPDIAKDKLMTGRVLSIGGPKIMENGNSVPITVKEGDRVLFGRYSGAEVEIEGQVVIVCEQSDLLAKLM